MEFNQESKKTTVKNLIEFNNYIAHITTKIKLQKEIVNSNADNVDKVREELIKAVKERKILDKLKDKSYLEYVKEVSNEDQKLNDEIVSYNYSQNNAGDENG